MRAWPLIAGFLSLSLALTLLVTVLLHSSVSPSTSSVTIREQIPAARSVPALESRLADLERRLGASVSHARVLERKLIETQRWLAKQEGKSSLEEEIVFLSYASHGGSDDRFCRCVESVLQMGFRYHLLGWGTAFKRFCRCSSFFGVELFFC